MCWDEVRGGTEVAGMFLRRSEEGCWYWSEGSTGMGDARAARELIGELLWDGASPLPLPLPLCFLVGRLEAEGEEVLFCVVA